MGSEGQFDKRFEKNHRQMLRILFISPLPPPITGHSIVSQSLLDHVSAEHEVFISNLSVASTHNGGITLKRIYEIIRVFKFIFINSPKVDIVYFTISESVFGNLKDLIIYFLLGKKIHHTYIHLHGGSLQVNVFEPFPILKRINKIFLSKVHSVIVSGQSHLKIFSKLIPKNKIICVSNFAEDKVFSKYKEIDENFKSTKWPIRILYLSGMTKLKGYETLIEAYELLTNEEKTKIEINFAGEFRCLKEKQQFTKRLEGLQSVLYHGLVDDIKKVELFKLAHIFCLPTMLLEGQPISILEAYAAGCCVITTPQPGILDIFENDINGFIVKPGSSGEIVQVLRKIIAHREICYHIARSNHATALKQYRKKSYVDHVKHILEVN